MTAPSIDFNDLGLVVGRVITVNEHGVTVVDPEPALASDTHTLAADGSGRAVEIHEDVTATVVSWVAGWLDDQGEPDYAAQVRAGHWRASGGGPMGRRTPSEEHAAARLRALGRLREALEGVRTAPPVQRERRDAEDRLYQAAEAVLAAETAREETGR